MQRILADEAPRAVAVAPGQAHAVPQHSTPPLRAPRGRPPAVAVVAGLVSLGDRPAPPRLDQLPADRSCPSGHVAASVAERRARQEVTA